MKKSILHSFLFVSCIYFISCTKDVKSPAKISNSKTSIKTNQVTTTQTTGGNGHTCGGGSNNSYNSSNGY